MKILFLTPHLPSPPTWGGARRMHGLISGLAVSHDVSVLSFVEPNGDHEQAVRATRQYCSEVVTIPNGRYELSGSRKRGLQLESLVSPSSYERLVYRRPAFQAALERMLGRGRYDIIAPAFPWMGYYSFPGDANVVLDEHNIEYDILRRTAAAETTLARRLYNYVEHAKVRREEQGIWRKVSGCSLASARDEGIVRRQHPRLQTAVVPNGVDTRYFRPGSVPVEPMTLVFFGALSYYPNTDGLLFFLRDVMPRIRRRYPSVRLLVVGPGAAQALAAWASENVVVTGLVDDVRPYLERAAVAIVPLRIGGGTRLKIVEAMAMGKAVISTRIGAEGLSVSDEKDILLADTAEEFAVGVCRLLSDTTLARRLGSAARRLVEDRYDWRISVRELERLYERVLHGPH